MAVAKGGVFTSDIQSGAGYYTDSSIFAARKTNVVDEEKRMIDKVFSIVDTDNSGRIDAGELREVFSIFGVETHYLDASINRIMQNVDKDGDGMISPMEFYKLLSLKFNKGDDPREMENVFMRMMQQGTQPVSQQSNRTGSMFGGGAQRGADMALGIDTLHKVALLLGEPTTTKQDIKDMIRCFKRLAKPILEAPQQTDANPEARNKARQDKAEQARKDQNKAFKEEDEGHPDSMLQLEEFKAIMNMDL